MVTIVRWPVPSGLSRSSALRRSRGRMVLPSLHTEPGETDWARVWCRCWCEWEWSRGWRWRGRRRGWRGWAGSRRRAEAESVRGGESKRSVSLYHSRAAQILTVSLLTSDQAEEMIAEKYAWSLYQDCCNSTLSSSSRCCNSSRTFSMLVEHFYVFIGV